ncbi:dTDP-4-dehydrorhamnose reductase [Candidatus Gottesmanbacteria bacterium]|nr:dTDP-4-dehydrorhamnose reductase [Candidatus Gottesmanbacteria bacterium]
MKTLIIGASGLVGGALYHQFRKKSHQVVGTYNTYKVDPFISLDITNKEQAEKTIADFGPDVVLSPAAFAHVDKCEQEPQLCRLVNVNGIKNLIDTIRNINTQFVFFSTDYVFDGKSGPYKEEDRTNPINLYGKLKLEVEEYIKDHLDRYLIIRTANVFGWERQNKNFVVNLISKNKRGEKMRIVNDQFGSPTYAPQLAQAIYCLVSDSRTGLYHVAGRSVIDRYSFALEVADVFDLDKSLISSITTSQLGQKVPRPQKGGLIIDKVEKVLPFKMYTSKEALAEMKKDDII